MCRLLVGAGAEVNARDAYGKTALAIALGFAPLETVHALIELGADVNAKTARGDRLLTAALRREKDDCLPFIQELVTMNADVLAANEDGLTAVDWALKLGNKESAKFLISVGAKATPEPELPQPATSFEDGATTVIISCRAITYDPTEADHAMGKRLRSMPATFLQNASWEDSPVHWAILGCLDKPHTLDRIAYVARGGNASEDIGLTDGPNVLGEAYADAVARFVDEGLVKLISIPELVALNSTSDELSKLAGAHKVRLPIRKNDKVPVFIVALPELAAQIAVRKAWYQRTEAGTARVRDTKWNAKPRLIDEHVEQLRRAVFNGDIDAAILQYLDLQSLSGEAYPRHLMATTVRTVRLVLHAPWPVKAIAPFANQRQLRAIAAFWELLPDKAREIANLEQDSWDVFGPIEVC